MNSYPQIDRSPLEIYGLDHLALVSDDHGDTRTLSVSQLCRLDDPGLGPRIAAGKLLDQSGDTFAIGDIHYASTHSAFPYLLVGTSFLAHPTTSLRVGEATPGPRSLSSRMRPRRRLRSRPGWTSRDNTDARGRGSRSAPGDQNYPLPHATACGAASATPGQGGRSGTS